MRIAIGQARGKPNQVEKFGDTNTSRGTAGQPAKRLKRATQNGTNDQAGIQRGMRILENHLQPGPQRVQRGLIEIRDVNPVEHQPPLARTEEAHQGPA